MSSFTRSFGERQNYGQVILHTRLSDILLPISGELRVKDPERVVGTSV